MIKQLWFIILISVLAFSCSNKVHVLKDESAQFAYGTSFTWIETTASEENLAPAPTSYADASMRRIANEYFLGRGWREVNLDPDVLVIYDVMVPRDEREQAEEVSRTYYNPFTRRYMPLRFPNQYRPYQETDSAAREAVIFISLVDANNDRLLWQGWSYQKLEGQELTDNVLSSATTAIFSKF